MTDVKQSKQSLDLPMEDIAPVYGIVQKLLIVANPKVGKTSMCLKLPNSLMIDLEGGAKSYGGRYMSIPDMCADHAMSPLQALNSIATKVAEANKKAGKFVYDYLIIDSITEIENLARLYATQSYKASAIGKSFTGTDVVSDLPQGAGYELLRSAFMKISGAFNGLAGQCIIYIGHIKNSSIQKDGQDLSARDLALMGKTKLILGASVDATGFLFRDKETSKNILSFKTTEQDLITGARPMHLANKEFLVSEMSPEGVLTTYWEHIFPNLSSNTDATKKK